MKKELTYLETIKQISEIKKHFESQLETRLGLTKVQSPIFLKTSTGLQDQLSGVEKAVTFSKGEENFEIVHSLAKWKREALGKYKFPIVILLRQWYTKIARREIPKYTRNIEKSFNEYLQNIMFLAEKMFINSSP